MAPMLAPMANLYMVDLIGFGRSPAPENFAYTIDAQAESILRFIRFKNLSDIVLVGHSYGGGVALTLLHKLMKDNEISRIKKLILIAPAAYPQSFPFFIMLPRIPFFGRFFITHISANFQIKVTLKKIFQHKKAVSNERIKRYVNNIAAPSSRNALIQTARNIMPRETDNLLAVIGKIHQPVLLVNGEKDAVISKKNLDRLSGTLPNCSTRTIIDCGHVPHEEYPRRTAELITRFL